MIRLYDTASLEVRELATREPGTVGIYLCGPTVYGPPHLGHGRAAPLASGRITIGIVQVRKVVNLWIKALEGFHGGEPPFF
jgi:hypothetical protein